MMKILFRILTFLISLIFGFSNFVADSTNQSISKYDDESINLRFAAISDVHMTGEDYDNDSMLRQASLEQGFRDINDDSIDLVVCAGDIANHGEPDQYKCYYDAIRNKLGDIPVITAVGNHDGWNTASEPFDDLRCYDAFLNSLNAYRAEKGMDALDVPYYTQVVNGYTFIVLSSEYSHLDAYISDTQIEWLDNQLAAASVDGKPMFVLCHWPINNSNGVDKYWDEGAMGDQSDRVEGVLNKYKNVFYISGHVHAGFRNMLAGTIYNIKSVQKMGNVWYINLPRYASLNGEGILSGYFSYPASNTGYVIEVTDTKINFRERNFALRHWYTLFSTSVDLV